jgi:quercetin dioxygenase-like cupin family protein
MRDSNESAPEWGARRVVIGPTSTGGSGVLSDGRAPNRFGFLPAFDTDPHDLESALDFSDGAVPAGGMDVIELWLADSDAAATEEIVTDAFDVECGAGRMRTRVTRMGPNLYRPLHKTSTTDVDIVLAGEVTVLSEHGEVVLRPGDALVLSAAVHGWRTGDTGCTLLVTMIGHPQS